MVETFTRMDEVGVIPSRQIKWFPSGQFNIKPAWLQMTADASFRPEVRRTGVEESMVFFI